MGNIKIGIIVAALGLGGAEHVAQKLADYYVDSGNQVVIITVRGNIKAVFSTKARVINLGYSGNSIDSSSGMSKAALKLKQVKKAERFDVVVSFEEICNCINALSKGKEKVVVSTRTLLSLRDEIKGPAYMEGKRIRRLYNKVEKVVAVGDAVKKDLEKYYGIKRDKLITIPNFAESPACDGGDWSYGEKVIICVGRLDDVKQFDRIIRAFSSIEKNNPEARLLIVGDGILRYYLEKYCHYLGISEKVIFTGTVSNVGYYLRHSRIFVMASRIEGFPNAMVEAMACGLPVISTNSPGGCTEIIGYDRLDVKEIEYGQYGILTPYIYGKPFFSSAIDEEEEKLGKAMEELLNDDVLRQEYEDKSRFRANHYSKDNIMRKWDSIIKG